MSATSKTVLGVSAVVILAAGLALGWIAGASSVGRARIDVPRDPSRGGGDPGAAGPVEVVGRATEPAATDGGVSVHFSPGGGCTDAIVREIAAAKQTVYVQAAQFTSAPIARALVAAHERGVEVQVIVDKDKSEDRTQATRLAGAGVPTFMDGRHGTAHNKVMVIDHQVVITGSFNFSKTAETDNAENLVILRDKPAVVAAYEQNFRQHLTHSDRFGQ